ncbi:LURP-one-related/scramblase family protein [Terribacillus saccharophilus]|uniref:LURP-one-related/scramblase family protein n=1 Tax=Terribacillus saccharophilus TaxID=361277 RepID=UPI003981A63D
MGTYYIKQKVFSFKDSFSVFDAEQQEVYRVRSKLFSLQDRLTITDLNDQPLVEIKQQLAFLKPRYIIEENGEQVAEVTKNFTFFKANFSLKPQNWSLDGDVWSHQYTLTDKNGALMHVTKKWFSWGDTYELQIEDETHLLTYIAVMIVLDMVLHNNNGTFSMDGGSGE